MKTAYAESLLDEIRQKTDIVGIVSEDVVLRKTGKNYVGLCPFHAERTPSFSVSPDKQIYYCFGCGAGGNVYSFLMKQRGLTFPEAVQELAAKAGVPLPEEEQTAEEKARRQEKEQLYAVNEQAAQYFSGLLTDSRLGAGAMAYLKQRGIEGQSIKDFRLGYAAPGWDDLLRRLTGKGYTPELLAKAGLVIARPEGNGYYDRFRDRLMFPISDVSGRVIGFGGRILGEGVPKYLNSPETPLFEKGRNLYGLHLAKAAIRQNNQAIIVEGYMDVVAPYQSGIRNLVASLGTALTAEQGRLLHQYGQDMILAYDADGAGQAATLRGMDILAEIGCNVRIVTLPEGEDPDTFVRRQGKAAFDRLVGSALALTEHKLKSIVESGNRSSIEGRANIIKQAAPVLNSLGSETELQLYVRSLAKKLEVTEEAIRTDLRNFSEKARRANGDYKDKAGKSTYNRNVVPPGRPVRPTLEPGYLKAERRLLQRMTESNRILELVRSEIGPQGFAEENHRAIAGVILSLDATGARIVPGQVVDHLSNAEAAVQQAAVEIFMREPLLPESETAVADYIRIVKEHIIDQELASLPEQIRLQESKGDLTESKRLQERYLALIRRKGR